MNDGKMENRIRKAREVLDEESRALSALSHSLDEAFSRAVAAILQGSGKVAVTGMGKSGHVARKIAATFSSTGTPAFFCTPEKRSTGTLERWTGAIPSLHFRKAAKRRKFWTFSPC